MVETKFKTKTNPTYLTLEETQDPKNASKLAHRTVSPKYGETDTEKHAVIGYIIGDWTPSHKEYLKAEEAKKKKNG
jgi:hypothetical protein